MVFYPQQESLQILPSEEFPEGIAHV